MSIETNPFSELRSALVRDGKPTGIATRLVHAVLAAKDYRGAMYLASSLDALEGGLMHTVYASAMRSCAFRSNRDWHYSYERLRHHAQSYLETQRHRAAA